MGRGWRRHPGVQQQEGRKLRTSEPPISCSALTCSTTADSFRRGGPNRSAEPGSVCALNSGQRRPEEMLQYVGTVHIFCQILGLSPSRRDSIVFYPKIVLQLQCLKLMGGRNSGCSPGEVWEALEETTGPWVRWRQPLALEALQ